LQEGTRKTEKNNREREKQLHQGTTRKRDYKKKPQQRPTFLVLNFGLHIVDGITALHLEGNGLARQGFHKDLHLDTIQKLLRLFQRQKKQQKGN